MDDPVAVCEVAMRKNIGQLVPAERFEFLVIDVDVSQRKGHSSQQRRLRTGQATRGRHGTRDPASDSVHLNQI
jgi:hypothetical protein